MDRLRERLPDCPRCTGVSVGRHAELFVPDDRRRFFSPWLSVTADIDGDGSRVRGRFGPHPSLWTGYMLLFFALGCGVLLATTWGYAQWALSHPPQALWGAAVGVVLAALLYLVSFVGQRLGQDQMHDLHVGLETLLGDEAPKP